ncbi:MAG: hypothetical protein IPP29_13415 [Bacteroidetes bacterium]|nr:hypothetical protein [Bacteroidota bacterium]
MADKPFHQTNFCRTTDGGTTWVAGTIADSNSSVAGLVSSCITAVDANNAWVSMWNTAGGTGQNYAYR